MDLISEENYIIAQAKRAIDKDPYTAKAWIITAKTLYANNFAVQFEAYKIEKGSFNYEEAAKCFSHIILTFQNQPSELWNEVAELTAALRKPEIEISPIQNFYVKMFQHLSYDVQHKILLLTVNHTENNYEQCKLLLLLLKRFPQAISTHTIRILELIAQGIATEPAKYREMLEKEALPLIYHYKIPKGLELEAGRLVCNIFTVSLEHYVNQMFNEVNKQNLYEIWKKIFFILNICGKILEWETFLPLEKNWSKDVYWQKLVQLIELKSSRTIDQSQIYFYAVTLFIFSLQEYIENINQKTEDSEMIYILVEGFHDWNDMRALEAEPPLISVPTNPSCSHETPIAFVTAANCWRFLNTHNAMEFRALLLKLPLSNQISQFLYDLAVYVGNHDEARNLMNELQSSELSYNIRSLSLILLQGQFTFKGFEFILKILPELPTVTGELLVNMTKDCKQRHLVLLPLTKRAIIQYCTLAVMNCLSQKVFEANCPDIILGNLLVLTQLEYPRESTLAEQIFSVINTKRQFSYLLFPPYIITIDFIEEFMHLWYSSNGEFVLEFTTSQANASGNRRIGTRGADKGVKEDFKQIIKQQVTRCNEDICTLIAQFLEKEHLSLIQSML